MQIQCILRLTQLQREYLKARYEIRGKQRIHGKSLLTVYIYPFCSSILLTAARTRTFSSQNQHLGRLVQLLTGFHHIPI